MSTLPCPSRSASPVYRRVRKVAHKAPRPRKPHPKPSPRPRLNPRNHWPAWTDERWTASVQVQVGPVASPSSVEPTARSEAWWSGWTVAYERDFEASPPSGMAPDLAISWRTGHAAGKLRRELDDQILDRRIDKSDDFETTLYGGYPT